MNTKRGPLLSDAQIGMPIGRIHALHTNEVRDIYEAARQKDAELIQMAVDMAHNRAFEWTDEKFRAVLCDTELVFLAAAEAAGFKPTQP